MTLADLIDAFRFRIDDSVGAYFVSDEKAATFLSEAEREAAVRARLLRGESRTAMNALSEEIPLPAKVFEVISVRFGRDASRLRDVGLTGFDTVDDHGLRHRGGRAGIPRFAVHAPTANAVYLFPASNQSGVAVVEWYRMPLYDMEEGDDEPEIAEEHHGGLVEWAAYRAYSSKDSELYDEARAQDALTKFADLYGERPTARVMRRHAERRRVTTRYGGIG